MYLEKLIEEPRHIEIQVIGIHTEKHVTFWKIVPYKGVIKIDWRNSFTIYDRRIASKMGEAAVKLLNTSNMKSGNGRVLVDKHRNFYFMKWRVFK
jgi:acetyl-CoA carboxylase biotin carboxylase subunit